MQRFEGLGSVGEHEAVEANLAVGAGRGEKLRQFGFGPLEGLAHFALQQLFNQLIPFPSHNAGRDGLFKALCPGFEEQ